MSTQSSPRVEAAILKYQDVLRDYECRHILDLPIEPHLLDVAKLEIAEAVLYARGVRSFITDSQIRAELCRLEELGEAPAPKRKPLPAWLRWKIFIRDRYRCRMCGARHDLTVDHIVAVSLGGSDAEVNLRTVCRSCNSRKGAQIMPGVSFPASSDDMKKAGWMYDNEAYCRYCGDPVEWWITPDGRKQAITVESTATITRASGDLRRPHRDVCTAL